MTTYNIVPPREPIADGQGKVTRTWWRFFNNLFQSAGSGSDLAIVPTGTLIDFAGGTVPSGWLSCDGSALSRIEYAALFDAIGTTWGAGDGEYTFNLPNFTQGGETVLKTHFQQGNGPVYPAYWVALKIIKT